MTRILITGGSSYLGQHLVPAAVEQNEVKYTFFHSDPLGLPYGRRLDIRDEAAVLRQVVAWQPHVIIHTAGSNRSPDMEEVICAGARHIVSAAAATGARLLHFSTDVVFDGRQAPYRESEQPSPIHAYGRAKARAEQTIARYPDHVIIRTSLIYGLDVKDRSTEWITASLRAGQPVTLFSDQIRNPVWTDTLSQACLELSHSDFRGTINIAGRQAMSRAEFGLKLLDWWGIIERDTLTIGRSDESWPLDCRLDLTLATELLATPLLGVDEVLNFMRGARLPSH